MGSMTPQLRGLGMSPLATAGNIELTPLNFVPGARMKRYLGPITLHFIKESSQVREVRKLCPLRSCCLAMDPLCYTVAYTPFLYPIAPSS